MLDTSIIEYFTNLVKIDSESKDEKDVAQYIENDLREMGAEVFYDMANEETGGNVGNLYARFKGTIEKEPILFCAHMDTVKPGKGISPIIGDEYIHTDGSTVLGSDDKSGIAEILYGIKTILDSGAEHAPIEVLFTISEEIGLLGAKFADTNLLHAKIGYAFDAHHVGEFMVGAPSQDSIKVIVRGKEAHAGVEPEKGINAIRVAAKALVTMPMGRIDEETTCNMGLIQGGAATNIVPNEVILRGEARSHDQQKLEALVEQIRQAFETAVKDETVGENAASFEFIVHHEYQAYYMPEDTAVVQLGVQALQNLGLSPVLQKGGGGSDANVFNNRGIQMIVSGTGMDKVHTVNERICIEELHKGAKLVTEMIRLYSNSK